MAIQHEASQVTIPQKIQKNRSYEGYHNTSRFRCVASLGLFIISTLAFLSDTGHPPINHHPSAQL